MMFDNKTSNHKSVIMIGPLTGEVNGQNIAFNYAVRAVPQAMIVDTNIKNIIELIRYLYNVLRSFFLCKGLVYITSSRTRISFWFRDLIVFFLAFILKRKVVTHLHGNDLQTFIKKTDFITKTFVNFFYSRHSIICFTAEKLKNDFSIFTHVNRAVIRNFYPIEAYNAKKIKKFEKKINILYLSNFIESKGYKILIDAYLEMIKTNNNLSLTLCGDYSDKENCKREGARNYIHKIRSFPGVSVYEKVSGKTKTEVLNDAHILILPTYYPTEASPISIIEGLVAGCYVISTFQGAIPELLEDFYCELIEPTKDNIVEAIDVFCSQSNKTSMSASNRKKAIDLYSPKNYMTSIRNLLMQDDVK